MNPDTNKFEMLQEQSEDSKRLEKLFETKKLLEHEIPSLVRPNGEPVPQHWTQFRVGELVEIKNYTFKVAYIGETSILFEPVAYIEVRSDGESKK